MMMMMLIRMIRRSEEVEEEDGVVDGGADDDNNEEADRFYEFGSCQGLFYFGKMCLFPGLFHQPRRVSYIAPNTPSGASHPRRQVTQTIQFHL